MRRRDFISRSGAACLLTTLGACGEDSQAPATTTPRNYATDFHAEENPLSEGGAWTNAGAVGRDWTNVRTRPGFAFGTQSGSGGYDDSVALLSGFPPNHSASGVLVVNPNISGDFHEAEIWLRGEIRAHHAVGYECSLAWNGSYCTVTRWDGPFGKFTQLAEVKSLGKRVTGDILSARIVGGTITVALNGSQILQVIDRKYKYGNPGIGFYREQNGENWDIGFSRYSATSL